MEKSEEKLITEILAGDTNTYAVLVKRYQKPIFNLMLRMTSSEADAQDLAQETFVRAYERLDRFKPSGRFFPWLYTIGLNLARDHVRKTIAAKTIEEKLREAHNPHLTEAESGESLPGGVDPEEVKTSLLALPLEYREAVFLRFHEGMVMREIAVALGISVSGAKMRVHRGLAKIRALLLGEGTHTT